MQHFLYEREKMYLSIERIAFGTLWKFFYDIFKAFHGYLHRQRIISCISLAILFEKEKEKKGKKKMKQHAKKKKKKVLSDLYPFSQEMHAS